MARPVTVTTDASGFTVVQQGDEGALIPPPGTGGERYDIPPQRLGIQSAAIGRPVTYEPAPDIRMNNTFGMK